MLLDVAQVVQKQFQEADLTPSELAVLPSLLVRQGLNRRPALGAAIVEIEGKTKHKLSAGLASSLR